MFLLKRSSEVRRHRSRPFLQTGSRLITLISGTEISTSSWIQPAVYSNWNDRKLSYSPNNAKMARLAPRTFPSSGFKTIDPSIKFEEETLPFYDPRIFYPVRLGEIFQGRYQVVAKLGWGAHSTIWLCHDLQDDLFRTLKVHINLIQNNRELEIYQHLKSPALEQSKHGGKQHLRELYDYFTVDGPHGTHDVFILRPLGTSIRDLQLFMPDRVFDPEVPPHALLQILPTIHFLHTEANITHTGSSSSGSVLARIPG